MSDELIDSKEVREILQVKSSNLRQLVHKKKLTPQGIKNRRSLFLAGEVEQLRLSRLPSLSSVVE